MIGVWATASRRKSRMFDGSPGTLRRARAVGAGLPAGQPAVQRGHRADGPQGHVERPLQPKGDSTVREVREHPELARLLPVLYPGVFPNLAAYHKPRADLNAILLTGIPSGS